MYYHTQTFIPKV